MSTQRPRIVILGAGFGGLFAARALAKVAADVTLVDRHNYHLFQPLLYQVATAGLPPSDIAWPIRSILSRQRNVRVLLAEVTGIDAAKHEVELHDRTLAFDYLIIATGSTHSYFGHEEWQALAPGLKSIDDATLIRRRVLRAFEAAEIEDDAAARERLLRFVIVGGGPTGVELAGTIAELARHTLAKDFRRIDPGAAKVILVEAGPRLLAAFHEPQSAYAARTLEKLGVEVRLGAAVTECDARGVALGAERIETGNGVVGGGRRRLTRRPLARGVDRPSGTSAGAAGTLDRERPCDLRDRRRGTRRDWWQARAWRRAGREAAGPLRRARARGSSRRPPRPAAVRLPRRRQPRDDRPAARGDRIPVPHAARLARVVDLGLRAHLLPGRRPEPGSDIAALALGVSDLRARRALDHGVGARGLTAGVAAEAAADDAAALEAAAAARSSASFGRPTARA